MPISFRILNNNFDFCNCGNLKPKRFKEYIPNAIHIYFKTLTSPIYKNDNKIACCFVILNKGIMCNRRCKRTSFGVIYVHKKTKSQAT